MKVIVVQVYGAYYLAPSVKGWNSQSAAHIAAMTYNEGKELKEAIALLKQIASRQQPDGSVIIDSCKTDCQMINDFLGRIATKGR